MIWYLDSSAILKLILDEREGPELTRMLSSQSSTSSISRVEVIRTVLRVAPEHISIARSELSKLSFLPVGNLVLNIAENFSDEITLKSLDAIHIASYISIAKELAGIITYDKQMIANAKLLGLKVISPGMK